MASVVSCVPAEPWPWGWAALAVLLACARPVLGNEGGHGDHDPPTDASGPSDEPSQGDSPVCEGPYCGDPANCGAPGVTCPRSFMVEGECNRGRCVIANACMAEMFDPPPGLTCALACADLDEGAAACAERGCGGHTAYAWPEPQSCGPAVFGALIPIDLACDEPIHFAELGGLSMSCCCFAP